MFVYGIYVDDECVYVGKTKRTLNARYMEHKNNMEKVRQGIYNGSQFVLYDTLIAAKDAGKEVGMKVLIDTNELMCNSPLFDRDIQDMELALITYLKPKCNIEGISKEYKFRY